MAKSKSLLPLEGVSPEGLIGLWIALRAMNYNAALRLTPSGSLRSPPTPYIGVGKGVTGFTFVSPVLHGEEQKPSSSGRGVTRGAHRVVDCPAGNEL